MKKVKLRKRTRKKLYFQHLPWIPLAYYPKNRRVVVNKDSYDGEIGRFGSFEIVSLNELEGYKNK